MTSAQVNPIQADNHEGGLNENEKAMETAGGEEIKAGNETKNSIEALNENSGVELLETKKEDLKLLEA